MKMSFHFPTNNSITSFIGAESLLLDNRGLNEIIVPVFVSTHVIVTMGQCRKNDN